MNDTGIGIGAIGRASTAQTKRIEQNNIIISQGRMAGK